MPEQQAQFNGWAIVEVMGHQRYAGHVTSEAYGGTVLFRVDVPELPAELSDGARKEAVPAFTKLFGAGSIYCLTPCTEEAARIAQAASFYRPWRLIESTAPMIEAGDGNDDNGF